jgi:hypothetical protein
MNLSCGGRTSGLLARATKDATAVSSRAAARNPLPGLAPIWHAVVPIPGYRQEQRLTSVAAPSQRIRFAPCRLATRQHWIVLICTVFYCAGACAIERAVADLRLGADRDSAAADATWAKRANVAAPRASDFAAIWRGCELEPRSARSHRPLADLMAQIATVVARGVARSVRQV